MLIFPGMPEALATFALGISRRFRGLVSRSVLALDIPSVAPQEASSGPPGRLFHAHGPVGLQSLHLSKDLLDFLLEDFRWPQEEVPPHFHPCVDHPDLPKHFYLEGYFHSMPSTAELASANPCSGHACTLPPAPRRLRAFAEALRRGNAARLRELAEGCPEGAVFGYTERIRYPMSY